jgi:hypothetical protein
MKKSLIVICLLVITSHTMAQFNQQYQSSKNDTKDASTFGFNRQSLFAGGTLGLGATNISFSAGATPEIGFTVREWLDVGGLINLNYYSERADPNYYYNQNERTRSFNYGIGAFARIFPVSFFFLQVEPQLNFITTTYTDYNAGGVPPTKYTFQATAPSLLLGGGYSQRIAGQSTFYLAVMFDALSDPNSPYRDNFNNTPVPVFQAGFDINLHPSGK